MWSLRYGFLGLELIRVSKSEASWEKSSKPTAELFGREDPKRLRGEENNRWHNYVVEVVRREARSRGNHTRMRPLLPGSSWVNSVCVGSRCVPCGDWWWGHCDQAFSWHAGTPS